MLNLSGLAGTIVTPRLVVSFYPPEDTKLEPFFHFTVKGLPRAALGGLREHSNFLGAAECTDVTTYQPHDVDHFS